MSRPQTRTEKKHVRRQAAAVVREERARERERLYGDPVGKYARARDEARGQMIGEFVAAFQALSNGYKDVAALGLGMATVSREWFLRHADNARREADILDRLERRTPCSIP